MDDLQNAYKNCIFIFNPGHVCVIMQTFVQKNRANLSYTEENKKIISVDESEIKYIF